MADFYHEYRKKLAKEIIENEVKLLGQIKVEDADYKKLVLYGRDVVENASNLSNPTYNLLLSVLMVQVAINHYQDGNYWKYFAQEVDAEVSSPKQNYLGKVFVKTVEFYNLLRLEKQFSQEQYVENIKAHAFVTNNYMAGFFEFATAFHENNLLRDLPSSSDDMLDAIESLSEYMKESMSNSSDSIKSGTARTAKTYKLLRATRRVFAQCDPVTLSGIFYPVLKAIDKDLFDQELPSGHLNRFESAYVSWREEQDAITQKSGKAIERLNRNTYGRKPYLTIDPITEIILLHIPAQTFRKADCESDASVGIRINGRVRIMKLDLRDSFGMYISEPIKLPIPDAFDEIDIRFLKTGGKRFTIKERDYRILTDNWKTAEKLSIGSNTILVRKGAGVYWNDYCEVIEENREYANWDLYTVIINKDSACKIGESSLSVVGEYSKKPIFDSEIDDYDILDEEKRKIVATRRHPIISFEVDKSLIMGSIININEKPFPLRDIPEEDRQSFIEGGKSVVIIDINSLVSCKEEGFYSVNLDVPTLGTRSICSYVLLRKVSCSFEYKYYMFRDEAKLHFYSPIHAVSGDPNWLVEDDVINSTSFTIPIDPDLQYVDLDFYLSGESERILYLRKPINVFSFGFTLDQKIYLRNRSDYVWHTELTDNLYIRIKDTEEVYAYYEDQSDRICPGECIAPGIFRINISDIRRTIESNYDAKWHTIRIFFDTKEGKSLALNDILLKNIIFPNPLMSVELDNGGIRILIDEIKGRAESLISIVDSETKQKVISERVLHEGDNVFPELDPSKQYDYILLSREGDQFGLFSETKEVNRQENVKAIDYSDLSGSSIKLKNIEHKGKRLELDRDYFIRINEKMPEGCYKAWMTGYERDENGKRTNPDYIREVLFVIANKGEYCRAMIAGKKGENSWGSLFYDVNHRKLLPSDNYLARTTNDDSLFIRLEFKETYFIFRRNSIRKSNKR